MIGWLAGLTGWALAAATFGIIVVSVAVVAGLGMVLVWLGAKAITGGVEHDWHNCQCDHCRRRRRATKKAGRPIWDNLDRKPRIHGHSEGRVIQNEEDKFPMSRFIPTRLLRVGMGVSMESGSAYVVRAINIDANTGGYVIGLENLQTRKASIVYVRNQDADLPYWRPLRDWGKGDV